MTSDILLDKSNLSHPRLVVEVPLESEDEIRQILEALAQEQVSAKTIVLDALCVAAEQTYFWTPEWQAKEKEADEAIANGRAKTFDTMDDLFEFLD